LARSAMSLEVCIKTEPDALFGRPEHVLSAADAVLYFINDPRHKSVDFSSLNMRHATNSCTMSMRCDEVGAAAGGRGVLVWKKPSPAGLLLAVRRAPGATAEVAQAAGLAMAKEGAAVPDGPIEACVKSDGDDAFVAHASFKTSAAAYRAFMSVVVYPRADTWPSGAKAIGTKTSAAMAKIGAAPGGKGGLVAGAVSSVGLLLALRHRATGV